MDLAYFGLLAVLIFGFGFVIFWHELGHFLAAKWAGVEVEQFAVGFGHALVSWRKGLGLRAKSSRAEFEGRVRKYLEENDAAINADPDLLGLSEKRLHDYAAEKIGISETEYRLNWIPLGGYVKMLGQDDLDPNAKSDSPSAYNNKPIFKRMVIVSAGVIMNIILAIGLFTLLFGIGFKAPIPVVGSVRSNSPAQVAGVRVGDRIISINGREQQDFTKIGPNVALTGAGEPMDVVVERVDGTREHLQITPRYADGDPAGFLGIGIEPIPMMRGIEPGKFSDEQKEILKKSALQPGESIVAINGREVNPDDYKSYVFLDQALQTGKPVMLTLEDAKGTRVDRAANPTFAAAFDRSWIDFAGMNPRTVVGSFQSWSSAKDKLKYDDVILEVRIDQNNDRIANLGFSALLKVLDNAGKNDQKVSMMVLRDGKVEGPIAGLDPSRWVDRKGNRKGLGIGLVMDEDHAVVADILPDSAAARAGIPAGATINSIGDAAISSWHDVQAAFAAAPIDQPVKISWTTDAGQKKDGTILLSSETAKAIASHHYVAVLPMREFNIARKTGNPLVAARWGVAETRDLTIQFYLMLRRMFEGSVSPDNAMGPIGIFAYGSMLASRGVDWVIWFLAMISANLAVVNFLPIPIVDGGLFLFLVLEKVMGRPLSARAQGIVQIVGLAFIVSVFLFVTYHDITRLFS